MLTRLYVEAQLADQELADQVRELWNVGLVTDEVAMWAWCILAAWPDAS